MTKASCHTCVYACWDLGQVMQGFSSGWPHRPMCANHPESSGWMQPTPLGNICRNYRPKPPAPEGDVRRIPLGRGMYAYVDAADYEWLSRHTWQAYHGGYAGRCEKGKVIYMHREIMKPPKGMVVDHIDGSKANNCRFNLRVCTRSQNLHNCAKHANTSSRFKGVGYDKSRDKYWARFRLNRHCMYLGYFDDEVEAARAYDYKAVECCGPFARVNLPEEWPPERVQEVHARYQAGLQGQGEEGAKSVKGRKARKGGGKRRTEDAGRRTAREKKAKRPEDKKAGRTRDASRTTKQGAVFR